MSYSYTPVFIKSRFYCVSLWILANISQARLGIARPTRFLSKTIKFASISRATRFFVGRARVHCEIFDQYRKLCIDLIPLVTQCDLKPDLLRMSWLTRNCINFHCVYQESKQFSSRLVEEKKLWSILLICPNSARLLRILKVLVHQKLFYLLVGEFVSKWFLRQNPCVKAAEIGSSSSV